MKYFNFAKLNRTLKKQAIGFIIVSKSTQRNEAFVKDYNKKLNQ